MSERHGISPEYQQRIDEAGRKAREEQEAAKKAEQAKMSRRAFGQLAVGAVTSGLLYKGGGAVAELYRYHERSEQEKKEIADALANVSWAEAAARAHTINLERERQRGMSPAERKTGASIGTIHRDRSTDVTPRDQTEVERVMRLPGGTLATENRMLASAAQDSLLFRHLLKLPDNAPGVDVVNMADALYQTFMEEVVSKIHKNQFDHQYPGAPGTKENNDFVKAVKGKFHLFLQDRPQIEEAVVRYSKMYNVPARRIYGLIGAEGSNKLDTESTAGAIGLLQLMYGTAKGMEQYSRKHGGNLSVNSPNDLKTIDTNVHAGVAYYASLLDRFGQHGLALMGYNGGPERITEALKGLQKKFPGELSTLRGGPEDWQQKGINLISLYSASKQPDLAPAVTNLNMQMGYALTNDYMGTVMHEVLHTREE